MNDTLTNQVQRRLRAPVPRTSQSFFSSANVCFHLLPARTPETLSLEATSS